MTYKYVINELINKMCNRLRKEHEENILNDNMLFIDGEVDSNQTIFELRSNHCEIGVLAKTKNLGYCLLLILRMIIDGNDKLLEYVMENVIDDEDITYNDDKFFDLFMKYLAAREQQYTTIYNAGDPISNTLHKYNKNTKAVETMFIVKKLINVDTWNIDSILKTIQSSFVY